MSETADHQAIAIWQKVLDELRKGQPKATFDTWLKPSAAVSLAENVLTIKVPNTYALEWLEAKLYNSIQKAARQALRRSVDIKIVVGQLSEDAVEAPKTEGKSAARSAESPIVVEVVDFDPTKKGFIQTSNYAIYFWQPLIGILPFAVWQLIKSFDYKGKYDPDSWPSIARIADTLARGDRSQIVGRAACKGRSATIGAIAVLEEQRLLWYKLTGEGRDLRYHFKVRGDLPVLTPSQVQSLPERIQQAHARFLKRCALDQEEWRHMTQSTLLPEFGPEPAVEIVS